MNENWNNNAIQFPRLLSEIYANCTIDLDTLCESMDLTPAEIMEIFERADNEWQAIKERTR